MDYISKGYKLPTIYHDIMNNHMKITKDKIYIMFIAIETSGLPKHSSHYTQLDAFDESRMLKLSWQIFSNGGKLCKKCDFFIKHDKLSDGSFDFVSFGENFLQKNGEDIVKILNIFAKDLDNVKAIVSHNLDFHLNILRSEIFRQNLGDIIKKINSKKLVCTMKSTRNFCKLPFPKAKTNEFKPPKLTELYTKCFEKNVDKPKNSEDVLKLVTECYYHLKEKALK
jgi:hypothetical protein